MFKTKSSNSKKSEDVKKSAGKVLDTKKDTPTRAKVKLIQSCQGNFWKCWSI